MKRFGRYVPLYIDHDFGSYPLGDVWHPFSFTRNPTVMRHEQGDWLGTAAVRHPITVKAIKATVPKKKTAHAASTAKRAA